MTTIDYNVGMSVVSIRFKDPTIHARLKRHAERNSGSLSATAERLVEEGLRMAAHPGIVFRDGPTGRRPGLAAGPDIWEVIGLLNHLGGALEERIVTTANSMDLSTHQVRAASGYYAEFKEEVDNRISRNRQEGERLYALWEAEQNLARDDGTSNRAKSPESKT